MSEKSWGNCELDPLGTNQKSFYGKARVERINTATGAVYDLHSYDTIVARVSYTLKGTAPCDIESSSFFVYNLQSATTIKHVKAFMHFIYKTHGLNFFKDGDTNGKTTLKYLKTILASTLKA